MPPANAAAISHILTDISHHLTPLRTRSAQQTYLETLTATHKFTYYSSTYGHTIHDAASLRKVLANIMRHHPNPEFGTAGGNAAVDMLFEFGCEMLEGRYVEEVRRAAGEEVVERREDDGEEEEEEISEEEGGEEVLDSKMIGGGDSENDEDFVPAGRRLRRREPSSILQRKRKVSSIESSAGGSPSAEKSRRDHGRKAVKRSQPRRPAATTSPLGGSSRGVRKVDEWRRSDVGEDEAASLKQDQEYDREEAETPVDRREGCQRSSGHLADCDQSQQSSEQPGMHATRADVGHSDNVKLREAVERLNRRVHTAIVQLWDEIGGIA